MEQVLVFASIIVGIAVSDEIVSLNRLLRARHRVHWDWLPLAVAALVLLIAVQIWWNLANARASSITIGQFLPTLIELILMALLAFAVLPDEVPSAGLDLRAYYLDQASYIWTLFVLALAWALLSGDVAAARNGNSWWSILTGQREDLVFLVLTASLIRVRRRWWHVAVLALLSIGPIHWLSRSVGKPPPPVVTRPAPPAVAQPAPR